MYKICIYVPTDQVEHVKSAIFAAGAGKIGDYEACVWQTLGEGQFKPLSGSRPFVGELNQVERVSEIKLELVCDEKYIHKVIDALKASHPYEEPAYQVIRLEDF